MKIGDLAVLSTFENLKNAGFIVAPVLWYRQNGFIVAPVLWYRQNKCARICPKVAPLSITRCDKKF